MAFQILQLEARGRHAITPRSSLVRPEGGRCRPPSHAGRTCDHAPFAWSQASRVAWMRSAGMSTYPAVVTSSTMPASVR